MRSDEHHFLWGNYGLNSCEGRDFIHLAAARNRVSRGVCDGGRPRLSLQ